MVGWLILPILVTIFPILSFYLTNISELSLRFLDKPLGYSIAVVLVLTIVLGLITKNKNKTALAVTLAVFVFFSYGHLSQFLENKLFIKLPGNLVLGPDKVLLPIVILLASFCVFKIVRTKTDFSREIKVLSLTLAVLVVYLTGSIFVRERRRNKSDTIALGQEQKQTGGKEETPDIYYIVLDGYAREDILKKIYGYDNSKVIASLRDMGFFVADKAKSNYIHTYLSLPSALNMTYLKDPISESTAIRLLYENSVMKKLKNNGYKTINFETWWEGTNENYPAEVKYAYKKNYKMAGVNLVTNESNMIFLQTTLLHPLIKEVWGDVLRGQVLTTLEKLPDIPYQKEKKFVLAHLTAPHPPYLFMADGSPVAGAELGMADEGFEKRENYLGQLTFVSNQILPILKKIISNSKKLPIIVLQSDHGPASIFGKREDWKKNYSQEGVGERTGVLYAIYFPDKDYRDFYETITPVNTFRIIFNKYFGEKMELLPDKTYYSNYEAKEGFKEVSN